MIDRTLTGRAIALLVEQGDHDYLGLRLESSAPMRALVEAIDLVSTARAKAFIAQVIGQRFRGARSAVPTLVVLSQGRSKMLRAAALEALGKIGDERGQAAAYERWVVETAPDLRAWALSALATTRHPLASREVIVGLDDDAWTVRQAAAWCAGFMRLGKAKKRLALIVEEDPDPSVVDAAKEALARLR